MMIDGPPQGRARRNQKRRLGRSESTNCLTCKRRATLDVAAQVRRLGPDHGCLHWDLIKVIYCHECRAAGRDDRNLQFTNHAITPDKRRR